MDFSAIYEDIRGKFSIVLADAPGPCGTCRAMTMWFVCRNGQTQCSVCDSKQTVAVTPRRLVIRFPSGVAARN